MSDTVVRYAIVLLLVMICGLLSDITDQLHRIKENLAVVQFQQGVRK